jgi:hypothetical protein
MASETSVPRYSTVADFELLVDGRSYKVAQVAPDFLLLENPAEIAPGGAVLVIRVEGQEIRRQINLPTGASPKAVRVKIARQS